LDCLIGFGTVSRNERFKEAAVEIFQRVTWRLAKSTGAPLQLWSDIGTPDLTNHSQSRPQLCGRTPRMHFQKIFNVFSDDGRQLFDLQ